MALLLNERERTNYLMVTRNELKLKCFLAKNFGETKGVLTVTIVIPRLGNRVVFATGDGGVSWSLHFEVPLIEVEFGIQG